MKFKNILFLLIMFVIFIENIKATDEIATCVYKKEEQVINVKIFTDYKFEVTTNFIEESVKSENRYTEKVVLTNDLQYNYFLDDDNKFKCADEIYLNTVIEKGGNQSSVYETTTHKISNNKQEAKNISNSMYSATSYKESINYRNDENSSKVYINSPSQADKQEGWLKTCTYGETIMRFNKEKVEFVKLAKSESSSGGPNTNVLLNQIESNNYACPITLCISNIGYGGYSHYSYTFYFDYSKIGQDGCITGTEYTDSKYKCVGVDTYYTNFIDSHNKYETTKAIDDLKIRNQNKTNLKSYCDLVMSNLNYNAIDECVKDCIEVEKEITEILKTPPSSQCGVSGRLIQFIGKIVKWMKYLVPVIVIVLSILDFIKAIGADKDDEIKKAQNKFIRRLIIAALIFIMPFIIEFVLNKMGFDANGCGIIDL